MKTSPLFSVILPSYNHADYVAAAVHSVLDQTVNDLELIVIDDGSTDGTPDIVENIKDSRIHLIKLTENRSKQPRNLALEIAQGKFVAFQNSDDVWHPQKLERQIDRLNKNPEHLTAERKTEEFVAGKGVVVKWDRIRRQNHFLDALYNACAAGHYAGARLVQEPRPEKNRVSFAEIQRRTSGRQSRR